MHTQLDKKHYYLNDIYNGYDKKISINVDIKLKKSKSTLLLGVVFFKKSQHVMVNSVRMILEES